MQKHSEKSHFIDYIFSKDGLLSKYHKDYEERSGQLQMSKQILSAYEENKVALIEAGTGIGKTMAYLVPALFWALKHKEKTVISTYTISLQEQLVYKDIPFLLKLLDLDLKAVLVKGFSNYVCLQRLEERPLASLKEQEEFDKIERWASKTKEGSKSEISFPLTASTWNKVCADASKCNNVRCSFYKSCFFFKARRQVDDAQILVVNHHLLFADISAKMAKDYHEEKSILPKHERVIFDEAHHIEQIALESLSKRFNDVSLLHLIEQFNAEGVSDEMSSSLRSRIEVEIPAEKNGVLAEVQKTFALFYTFIKPFLKSDTEEQKILLEEKILSKDFWQVELILQIQKLVASLTSFSSRLFCLKNDLEKLENKNEELIFSLQAITSRLEEQIDVLANFFKEAKEKKSRVRWIEVHKKGTTLVDADLDTATYLNKYLFNRLNSTSLCSATLTTGKDFNYLKSRLGLLNHKEISESVFESPFDYPNRALLLVPTDLPLPSEPDFNNSAKDAIVNAVRASKGNAFILFTSYEMLRDCYEKVHDLLTNEGYSLLKQGDSSRQYLLELFKAKEGSVLFGTDSFWEGVDVAGEKLRLVVIAKLPFKAPDDPLTQAQSSYLLSQGKDPFFDYSVPLAIVKFKQGFGRLMRTKNDRGCVLCLDKRLVTKGYGKLFLKSLPSCATLFDKQEKIFDKMTKFYSSPL